MTTNQNTATTSPRLVDELNTLHASYVDAVNAAIGAGDVARAERLAADYDDEAVRLIAVRENRTHLLPLARPETPDTPLRRLVRRLSGTRAA